MTGTITTNTLIRQKKTATYVYQYVSLPRETLFHIINTRLSLPLSTNTANVITQTAIAADKNAHGTNLILDLHTDQCVNIRTAREHLHGCRGALDLLGVARPCNKEHNAQDFTAAIHCQDTGHPGPDPLQVFGGLDNPDEGDAAGGDGAIREPGDQMTDEGDVVGDADSAGEEHHRTV